MKNTIIVERNELQQQIDLKNYYMGDSAKRKDPDADTIQSSKDDEELLFMLVRRAANELVTAVALRFPTIGFTLDDNYITFEFETIDGSRSHLLPMLKQSITDFIANEVTMHWLLLRNPAMAQAYISIRGSLYDNAQRMFAKFYNREKIRRRSTDLAGI